MRKIIIASFIVFGFQMCSTKSIDKPIVKLDSQIDGILVRYQNQLKVKNIDVNFQDSSLRGDTLNIVQVLLFNPNNLPKYDVEIEKLSLEIASDVYKYLINKKDFGRIDIDYIFEEGELCNPYRTIKYKYAYADIDRILIGKQ